jgi:hypothetical protein
MLGYLDGLDRLRSALSSLDFEGQGWYAIWALRSFDKALTDLAASDACRTKEKGCRAEYDPQVMAGRIVELRQKALALVPRLVVPDRPFMLMLV